MPFFSFIGVPHSGQASSDSMAPRLARWTDRLIVFIAPILFFVEGDDNALAAENELQVDDELAD